MNNTLHN